MQGSTVLDPRLLGIQPRPEAHMCAQVCPCWASSVCWHMPLWCVPVPRCAASVTCLCVSAPAGIMLGRMGDNGTPLVSFCQCLNESVMKIVAVAVW